MLVACGTSNVHGEQTTPIVVGRYLKLMGTGSDPAKARLDFVPVLCQRHPRLLDLRWSQAFGSTFPGKGVNIKFRTRQAVGKGAWRVR